VEQNYASSSQDSEAVYDEAGRVPEAGRDDEAAASSEACRSVCSLFPGGANTHRY